MAIRIERAPAACGSHHTSALGDRQPELHQERKPVLGRMTIRELTSRAPSEGVAAELVEAGCAIIEPQLLLEVLQEQAQYVASLPERQTLSKQFRRMEPAGILAGAIARAFAVENHCQEPSLGDPRCEHDKNNPGGSFSRRG